MQLQRVFKTDYSDYLYKHIYRGEYRQKKFSYDEKRVKVLANIYQPEGLAYKMDAKDDFKSAIALYESYESLPPIVACMPDLWIYLSHVDLFNYMQQRRPTVMSEDCPIDYIERHWFKNKVSMFRMTLFGFWWNVYLTIEKDRENPYELTEILFKNQELRTSSFGELPLIRYRGAMRGVLEFIKENPEIFESGFNMKARYIQKLFNNIGGYKKLSFMSKEFFKHELEKRKSTLCEKMSREYIQNNHEIFNDILR